ncbi:hypothetical protein AV654_01435 [Paenibacillus elgii]|uniref:Uncharacterized protein n=1 Tax=Paenibacillus elgii TaxID=189691 RepID=A0A161SHZ7_9BACL|nr:hypothetical protein AV654_01435 [Paenibacillus elgii]
MIPIPKLQNYGKNFMSIKGGRKGESVTYAVKTRGSFNKSECAGRRQGKDFTAGFRTILVIFKDGYHSFL